MIRSVSNGLVRAVTAISILSASAAFPALAQGGGKELSDRAKERDTNKNGVIDPDEAGGPLKASFAEIDCDKSGTLDGAEIRGFFTGEGCPKTAAPAQAGNPAPAAQPASGSDGERVRAVRIDKVIVEPLSQTYPVIGRIAARRGGEVAARINGAVSEMRVDVGDRVSEGDVIARLAQQRLAAERDKYQAALRTRRAMIATAEAELAKVRQELRRIEGLKQSAAFSRARYEDLLRDVETRKATLVERGTQANEAEAELQRAEIDVYNATVRAPYDGIVSERHTEVGAYVNVGAPVVSMINDKDIEIEAEVPTDRVSGLEPGTPVRFRLDDGTRHTAQVRAVVPQENLRTRTRPVRFSPQFGEASKPFAINQSVTLDIPIGRVRNVVTVHKDAIVRRGDKVVVYIVRNDRAFPRDVQIGEAVGNRYIVISGIEPGDTTITHGNETLPPASRVEIFDDGEKRVGQ